MDVLLIILLTKKQNNLPLLLKNPIQFDFLTNNANVEAFISFNRAKNHTLILASNTDAIHFPYCIDSFDVLKLFDKYFLSHEMGLLKPDPVYFHQVLYQLWALPANCIFIDDRIGNVRSAQSLGIKGLVFESLDKLKSDLSSLI